MSGQTLIQWMHDCAQQGQIPAVIPSRTPGIHFYAATYQWRPHRDYEHNMTLRALTALVACHRTYQAFP